MEKIKAKLKIFREEKLKQEIFKFEKCQKIYELQVKEIDNYYVDKGFDALLYVDMDNEKRLLQFYEYLKIFEQNSSKHFFIIKNFIEEFALLRDFINENNIELTQILQTLENNKITSLNIDLSENEQLVKSLDNAVAEFGIENKHTLGLKQDFAEIENYYYNKYTLNQTLFNTLVTFKHLAIIAKTLKLIFDLKFDSLAKHKYVFECKDLIESIYQNYISAFEDYVRRITSRIVDDITDELCEQSRLGERLCKIVVEG